ncbi:RidA family protein [Streptomyces sp. NPDC002812]|uniref:RidA family protein n=1 Tax=Streptomyces sp. NPDC002812 TaxID=3154434 RepID=UPI003331678C
MSTPEERLAEAGHVLPAIATPVAAYTPALRNGPYVFVSGQLPTIDDKLIHVGKVGAEVTPERAADAARQSGVHARSAVGVAMLSQNAPVVIDVQFEV